jgi:molybdopterin-containing oxidoreductase family membrane subunit
MFDHGQPSYADVNKDILSTMLETGPSYWLLLGTTMSVAGICFFMPWIYQLFVGVGAAGMNRNAVWGSYLSNFIFWIGLSHSGTLLSAVLHITNSPWRKSIYRSAEAMTLFSLMTAALFVMVHVGRVWFVHWKIGRAHV